MSSASRSARPGLRQVLHLVTHPDGIEHVLAGDPSGYTKDAPFFREIAAYLGDGLLTGHRLPAGSIVLLSPWATHRRPDLWPDPRRFDPARFTSEAEAGRPRYAYFPFAGGPRGCIGAHFAIAETVVAVATLLGRYTLVSESDNVALSTDITLRPAGPVRCQVTCR